MARPYQNATAAQRGISLIIFITTVNYGLICWSFNRLKECYRLKNYCKTEQASLNFYKIILDNFFLEIMFLRLSLERQKF